MPAVGLEPIKQALKALISQQIFEIVSYFVAYTQFRSEDMYSFILSSSAFFVSSMMCW